MYVKLYILNFIVKYDYRVKICFVCKNVNLTCKVIILTLKFVFANSIKLLKINPFSKWCKISSLNNQSFKHFTLNKLC